MAVLKAFDGATRQLSLSEIATRTGMDMSTVQRFTSTLLSLGYLARGVENKKFELTPKILDFTHQYLSSHELLPRATLVLQQLSQDTGEVSSMTVLDDTEIVFIARIISRNILTYTKLVVGSRLPVYCSSSGRAMLATLDEPQVDDLLARSDLVRHTPHTLVDVDDIKAELVTVREKGYALTEDQYYMGDISLGAAVRDARGYAIGGVSIAISRACWQPESDLPRYANLVMNAAYSLSAVT